MNSQDSNKEHSPPPRMFHTKDKRTFPSSQNVTQDRTREYSPSHTTLLRTGLGNISLFTERSIEKDRTEPKNIPLLTDRSQDTTRGHSPPHRTFHRTEPENILLLLESSIGQDRTRLEDIPLLTERSIGQNLRTFPSSQYVPQDRS